MTVSATTSRADYTGNGATLAFTIPFYFLDNTHVKIIRTTISTGVPTTLALTTDYTLSGAGSGSGGTATMVVAPTTDQRLAILRNVPLTQLTHYVPNDPFPAATHEQALDQLTMEVQQINETVGRALTLDASVVNASGALPAPTANAFIGWNANATGFQNYAGISNVTVSSAMQPVVQAVNISTARGLLGAAGSGANTDITSLSNVTVPTQTAGNSSGLISNTAFVATAISSIALFKNRLINAWMNIDQRNAGASQTITAAAALAYTVDRWYAYCTGANVAGQRVAGTTPNQYLYQFTGAASVTKIGFAQRMEAANTQDLAGSTCTLSAELSNSLLTTVTWTAWYANSNDTFGTLASPTRTQIATGTFTVSSTLTKYSTQISVPSAATTGIEVEFSVGAQTSGTFKIGRVQFESGAVSGAYEIRPFGVELGMCQRYWETNYDYGTVAGAAVSAGCDTTLTLSTSGILSFNCRYKSAKRATPTISYWAPTSGTASRVRDFTGSADINPNVGVQLVGFNGFNIHDTSALSGSRNCGVFWAASAEL